MESAPYYRGDKRERREFERTSPEGIAKSLSHCHDINKRLIRDKDEMRKEFNYRLRNQAVLVVLTWIPAISAFVLALLR